MKTIDQTRSERLAMLIAEHGGSAQLAERIKRSASQVSQWLNASPDSKTGKPRTISNASARYIEKQCGKLSGWMDQPAEDETGRKKAHVGGLPAPPDIAEVTKLMISMTMTGRNAVLDFARFTATRQRAGDCESTVKANGVQ